MKCKTIICLLILTRFLSYSQNGSLTGTLASIDNKPIANANIQIFETTETTKALSGVISSGLGEFQLSNLSSGKYFLEISHINFEYYFEELTILNNEQKKLGTIHLQDLSQKIDEITISGKRFPITQTADKITVNVGSNVISAGGTPLDILKQLPIIYVSSEGDISIRGKGDIQILIDGKPSGFAALQGQRFLDQMDLSTIDKIEVITNPSVAQSSNGAGGVINIIKKKDQSSGFNGRINTGFGNDEWYHFSPGFKYRLGDINLFLNYTHRNRKRLSENTSLRALQLSDESKVIDQEQTGIRDDARHNAELGLDYYISESKYITFSGNYRNRNKKDIQNRTTFSTGSNNFEETRTGIIKEPETNEGWGAMAAFTSSPNKEKSVTLLLDYVHSVEDEDIFREELVSSNLGDSIAGVQTFYVDNNDRLFFDFERKSTLKDSSVLTFGTQLVYRKINQTYNALEYNNTKSQYENIPALDDVFNYEDFVGSLYFQLEKEINKWSYEAAVRFEVLKNKFNSESVTETFEDSYFKFFPSAKLIYEFNDKTSGVLSVRKGINRPSPNRLNPFPDFSNAFTISIGNPNLRPEVFYNIEAGINTKIKNLSLNSGVFYTIYTDLIQRITELRDDGLTYRIPTNVNNMLHYGIDLSMQINPTNWWNQQIGGLLYNRRYKDNLIETSNMVSYQFKSTSTVNITSKMEFQLFGNYTASENSIQGEIEPMYYVDAGIEYEFLGKKARLSLTATDIFNTLKETSTLINEGLISTGTNKINTRRLYLSFNYKF